MSRDPSLHITKTTLVKVLGKVFEASKIKGVDIQKVANDITRLSKTYSITHRAIFISNDKIDKKAKQLGNTTRYDANNFSILLHNIRKKHRHRGISPIKSGHKDWPIIKDIANNALEFCNDFNLPHRRGFIKYIEIGMDKMPKFYLNRFLSLHEDICQVYQAIEEIEQDSDPIITEQMFRYYNSYIIGNTGIKDDSDKIPEKYVWFVRARKQCAELNVSVEVYIKAQFEALDFAKGIPHPTQLVGAKAKERLTRYIYKKGIKLKNGTRKK